MTIPLICLLSAVHSHRAGALFSERSIPLFFLFVGVFVYCCCCCFRYNRPLIAEPSFVLVTSGPRDHVGRIRMCYGARVALTYKQ